MIPTGGGMNFLMDSEVMLQKLDLMLSNWGKDFSYIQKDFSFNNESDFAQINLDEDLNLTLNMRSSQMIQKIIKAKEKILNGDYGYCDDCGDSIDHDRLNAKPFADRCIGCQEEVEYKSQFHLLKTTPKNAFTYVTRAPSVTFGKDIKIQIKTLDEHLQTG